MKDIFHFGTGLSLVDKIVATCFKSFQQRLCERYAMANPNEIEIQLHRHDCLLLNGSNYRVEIWNKTKYNGQYSHSASDCCFGYGISISDAFSDLLGKIVEYEGKSWKTIYRRHVGLLIERIISWENEQLK